MNKPRIALTALSLAALALPASAAAKAPVYKATVKGSQVSTWGQHHAPQFACDATVNGSGSQQVRFESEPLKLTLVKAKGTLPVLAQVGDQGAKYGAPMPVPATAMVDREGDQQIDSPGGACNGEGGWNGEQPAKDCGRRFGRIDLRIGYGLPYSEPALAAAYKDVLTVTGHYDQFAEVHDSSDPATFSGDPLGHTYENCPYWADGPASPAIDELLEAGEKFPVKKLSALKKGKSKTISGDERTESVQGDFNGETLTTWNLKLKRVK
jgi:hypothetical protein